MNQFGDLYSQYYDLLYQDKSYVDEAEYVDDLIQKVFPQAKTMLDMGCGTGKHAELFCDKGYSVFGIDLSEDMLKVANQRRLGKEDKLEFCQAKISDLDLGKKFDVVVSLFHVMSYQNSNEELTKAFAAAKKHLNDDGIFIFDFWYGPAVLTDLPSTRVKRLENDDIRVTRIAEPVLDAEKNTVDVHYDVFIEEKQSSNVVRKFELHKMRYFFDPELELICESVGLQPLYKYQWMSNEKPDFASWNAVWIARKKF